MSPTSSGPSIAERAFLKAVIAWQGAAEPGDWEVFSPSWRRRLEGGWREVPQVDPSTAAHELAQEHRAQVRADLARVHPSWWVRALQQERGSVQRAFVASLPPSVRAPVQHALGLSDEELRPAGAPAPDVGAWAVALAGERLVGDVAERPEDSLVIVALSRLETTSLVRLVHAAGLAKWSLASSRPPLSRKPRREALETFRTRLGEMEPGAAALAERDLERARGETKRKIVGELGLMTLARLLVAAEPYRVRWALQHLPYALAKRIRSLMTPAEARQESVLGVERSFLRAAWEQLCDEGRIAIEGRPEE